MLQPNGFNHPALCTSDLKEALFYFNDVLGFPLVALYWMHGAENTVHAFLGVNDTSLLGFVYNADVSPTIQPGITHPASSESPSTRGTMHHMSFNLDSVEDLETLRESIQAKGIECRDSSGPTHPNSFEFAGPDGTILQACCKPSLDTESLFDLDAARAVGVDQERLKELRSHRAFAPLDSPVPNAPMGEDAGYHMDMPGGAYPAMINLPDQLIFEATRDPIPPTEKQSFDLQQAIAKIKMTALIIVGMIFKKRSQA